jgi:ribosomal protein S18 acetylase RimI-like enzyme
MEKVIYRPLTCNDEPFLWEMLFEAAHMTESKETITEAKSNPTLSLYVDGFGNKLTDIGFLAIHEITKEKIGAAWVRLLIDDSKGYSFIDNETAELAMAIVKNYRNSGIGSKLLSLLIETTQKKFNAIGLSVRDSNPALRLYRRFGFKIIDQGGILNRVGGTSYLMKLKL